MAGFCLGRESFKVINSEINNYELLLYPSAIGQSLFLCIFKKCERVKVNKDNKQTS